jgi:methyltransferase family protein
MHAAVKPGAAEALAARVLYLLQGYRASCVIATAVKMGLLDQLDAGPLSVDELAKRLQAHGTSLKRFLHALEALGVVESRANAVGLAPAGRLLVDPRAGLREWAILSAEEYMPAWVKLGESVMTGEPVFPAAFGMNVREHRKTHPELDESLVPGTRWTRWCRREMHWSVRWCGSGGICWRFRKSGYETISSTSVATRCSPCGCSTP